jgi:oxygen-independent coproporphyrinogen-3 oxidase
LLKKSGVNRLSIGLQSWDNNILRYLGRIHRVEDFIQNYNLARDIGFNNINVDLMSSIQGQTMEIFSSTLDNVISLKPEHISCYSLIIEEGTVFGERYKSGLLHEVDEDTDRDMYYFAVKRLKESGYFRYEISNFAKPGYESRHNIIYWETKPYLGIGAGAHSYIGNTRFSNEISPEKYINSITSHELPVVSEEVLTFDDKMSEFMFMGLRMSRGIELEEFKQRFDAELLSIYSSEIESLVSKKLVCLKDNRLFLTDKGIDLSNQVFVEFLK